MAAGAMILYPPNMGTPSNLIENGKTGIVSQVDTWKDTILYFSQNRDEYNIVTTEARKLAVAERWEVQASRFYTYFTGVVENG
jgi:hypothetical protein